MKSILRISLAIALVVLSSSSFAQQAIELCSDDDHKITMEHDKSVEWYAKEWNDTTFRYKTTSTTLDLDALYPNNTLSHIQVYSVEKLPDCTITISDTLDIVPKGYFTPEMIDSALVLTRNTLINDTSTFVLRPEYRDLLDPNAVGSPDSIYFSTPVLAGKKGEDFVLTQRITSDTLYYIIPPTTIIRAENETDFSSELEILGRWDGCDQTDALNLPEFIWDESNYIAQAVQNDEPNGIYFFISGLEKEMKAGESPDNLLGITNTATDSLKNFAYEVFYYSNDPSITEGTTSLTKKDSLKFGPKQTYYSAVEEDILYPLELATGKYDVFVAMYEESTGKQVMSDSQEFPFVNDADHDPLVELSILSGAYLGEEHQMNFQLVGSPFRSFFDTKMAYYFLSEDKQDTTEVQEILMSYLGQSDTLNIDFPMLTESKNYEYDTLYMSLMAQEGYRIADYKLATHFINLLVRPKNGLVNQSIGGHYDYNQVFLGDTIVGFASYIPEYAQDAYPWLRKFENLPASATVGMLSSYSNSPDLDLGYYIRF